MHAIPADQMTRTEMAVTRGEALLVLISDNHGIGTILKEVPDAICKSGLCVGNDTYGTEFPSRGPGVIDGITCQIGGCLAPQPFVMPE